LTATGACRGELASADIHAGRADRLGARRPALDQLAEQQRPRKLRRGVHRGLERLVLEARQQRRGQRRRPGAAQRLDRDARGLGLAPLARLDLDVAAQSQLQEAGDRLLEGRHVRWQRGARRLGDQPVDPHGALERGVVHQDRHPIGGRA
jgi:hypothetical protein